MKRLDQFIFEQGNYSSRAQVQDAIKEGRVWVDGKCITKNAFSILENMNIQIQEPELSFVSRAGFKLYDALEDFQITLQDRIVMDIGASTGGFSDVCLKKGASLVYAMDVGKDQLVDSIKNHPKVIEMSQCNCRYLEANMFSKIPSFACIDVSFISLKLIIPALLNVNKNLEIVALIKPQFEAGRDKIGKNGIIKDEKIHVQVLNDMISYIQSLGLSIQHIQASSILGRDGNKEFILHFSNQTCNRVFDTKQIVKSYKTRR